ncbi:hypothetical protein GCM10023115_01780 [Pontixanthobacter gangjinensis]
MLTRLKKKALAAACPTWAAWAVWEEWAASKALNSRKANKEARGRDSPGLSFHAKLTHRTGNLEHHLRIRRS